jgi:signal peptidase II
MSLLARRIAAIVAAALVFALDQWIKLQVIGRWGVLASSQRAAALGHRDPGIEIGIAFFRLTWTENYGVSLGMLTAQSVEMRYLLVALTSLIALVVLVWMLREKVWPELLGLALVLGGALGNIYDRSTRGFVVDYADFQLGEWRPFLIFNFADAAITVGVLIILARSLFSREKPKPADPGDTDTVPES